MEKLGVQLKSKLWDKVSSKVIGDKYVAAAAAAVVVVVVFPLRLSLFLLTLIILKNLS